MVLMRWILMLLLIVGSWLLLFSMDMCGVDVLF